MLVSHGAPAFEILLCYGASGGSVQGGKICGSLIRITLSHRTFLSCITETLAEGFAPARIKTSLNAYTEFSFFVTGRSAEALSTS